MRYWAVFYPRSKTEIWSETLRKTRRESTDQAAYETDSSSHKDSVWGRLESIGYRCRKVKIEVQP